jgi:hypothetical protein
MRDDSVLWLIWFFGFIVLFRANSDAAGHDLIG